MSKSKEGAIAFTSVFLPAKYLVPHWMNRLIEDCENEGNEDSWPVILLDSHSRRAVWNVCQALGTTADGVAAQACRLMERYLAVKLKTTIASLHSDGRNEDAQQTWDEFKLLMAEKMVLLIASCVQLAAKMNCAGVQLTTKKVRSVLLNKGMNYSMDEVGAAEFDVFHALDFQIPLWTSVEVAELLAQEIDLPQNKFRVLSATVQFAEFRRNEIERHSRWVADMSPSGKSSVSTLHLCAGAVAATARFAGGRAADPSPHLARLTAAPPLLISCLADLIVGFVLDSDSSGQSDA